MIAILACILLLGAVLFRIYFYDSPSGGAHAAEADVGPMSTPVSLDQLRTNADDSPQDVTAWQELAFAYFSSNMFAESAEAYRTAAEIAPDTAVLWSSLGEALVMASEDDPLPADAMQAFGRALEIDPTDPRARYFQAVEKDLAGNHEGAIAGWLALLADTAPGSPWETDLVRTIEQVGAIREIEVASRIEQASGTRNILPGSTSLPGPLPTPVMSGIPGPSQDQLAAASAIPPSEQEDMAEAMVARLAARLENEPANVDGWIMLMRSYKTLGRDADASQAFRSSIAANPSAEAQLRDAAGTLGVGG